jgi:putative transposase
MRKGFLYLVAVMARHEAATGPRPMARATRKVLSWKLSNSMEADFCIEALQEAIAKYGKPAIFNTDQGSQFTCPGFVDVLLEAEI